MKVNAIASSNSTGGVFLKSSQSLYPSGFNFSGVQSGLSSLKGFSSGYMGFPSYESFFQNVFVPKWQYWQSHRDVRPPHWWESRNHWRNRRNQNKTAYTNPYSSYFSPAVRTLPYGNFGPLAEFSSGIFTVKSLLVSTVGWLAMIFI